MQKKELNDNSKVAGTHFSLHLGNAGQEAGVVATASQGARIEFVIYSILYSFNT